MLKQLMFVLFSSILMSHASAQSTASEAEIESENPYISALPAWASVLNKFVDEQGRVDFVSLSNDNAELKRFVDAIAQVSPASHPQLFESREEVLAYHINTYNALAMQGVIDRNIPANFSSLLKRASFFKFRKVLIGGKKTDLYTYENKVIRPLGEARLHFALNCMVRDCPRLPTTVFRGSTLDADLQAAAVEFFTKEKHTRLDSEKKKLKLSGIMKFYTKDYVESGKKQDLLAYVNQFRDEKVPDDYRVEFIKYDWTINQQP